MLSSAEAVASYENGPAAGGPAVTRNAHGAGTAWYLSTRLSGDDLLRFVSRVLAHAGVRVAPPPAGLEVVDRGDARFLINHSDEDVTHGGVDVRAREAVVTRRRDAAAPAPQTSRSAITG